MCATGALEGAELQALATWLFKAFNPDGEPMSALQNTEQSTKLLSRLDSDSDGSMSFEEFNSWFRSTCRSVEHFRRSQVFPSTPHWHTTHCTAHHTLGQSATDQTLLSLLISHKQSKTAR